MSPDVISPENGSRCRFYKSKPYPEAFLKISEKEMLKAEETLFIDDTAGNIEGAKQAGLQTNFLLPRKQY